MRRRTLLGAGALLAGAGAARRVIARPVAAGSGALPADPFTLGVASGYPHPHGMVLWTRLAPEPDAPHGGMPAVPIRVQVLVARDEAFRHVVRRHTAWAVPDWAHSLHVETAGLEPDRWYWYRFEAGGWTSPAGRTRTAPAADAPDPRLRFAVACCQHYEHGYFNAYRAIVDDGPDLIVHLGDYLYENHAGPGAVRRLDGPAPVTLSDYRIHHARYRRDPDLQRAHAACPWLLTWDDHEVDNDYAGDRSAGDWPPAWFRARRAAAYRAYYEHMPLPRTMLPVGADMRIHGEWWFGGLARFFMLDTRQYRDPEACPDIRAAFLRGLDPDRCPALHDPARSMLGRQQRDWLLARLPANPDVPWTFLGNQTLMQPAAVSVREGPRLVFTDGWDGYFGERAALLAALASERVPNPVVLSGDVHAFYANALLRDDSAPAQGVAATEFVCGAITSPVPSPRFVARVQAEHPAVRFTHTDKRGFLRIDLERSALRATMVGMSTVREPRALPIEIARFEVAAGRRGPTLVG